MTYMISSTYLNWLHITPYHIYWHWCEYRKSINDDVIDRYNDMLIEAISIWEGGRVFPPTMQEKLRHDVAVATSRRNNNYVPTQWQLRRDAVSGASYPLSSKALLKFERAFFWSSKEPFLNLKQASLPFLVIKRRKKGLYWTQKPLFVQSMHQAFQWIEKQKVSKKHLNISKLRRFWYT